MKLLGVLLIVIVSFIGLCFLVHICSQNNYVVEYKSNKRQIKVYPAKNRPTNHHKDKA